MTVPSAAETEMDMAGITEMDTKADTDSPGTTETTCVPRMVITVPKAALTEIEMAGMAEMLTGPVTRAFTETPGTTETTCVPKIVIMVPSAALTEMLIAGIAEMLTGPVTRAFTENPAAIVFTVAFIVCVGASQTTCALIADCVAAVVPGAAPPATTFTASVPRTVTTVPRTALTEIDTAGMAETETGPVTKAFTETPGTTDTTCVPSTVTTVPSTALTEIDTAGIAETLTTPLTGIGLVTPTFPPSASAVPRTTLTRWTTPLEPKSSAHTV